MILPNSGAAKKKMVAVYHNKRFMGTVGSGDVVKRYFLSKALVALALG